jgi:alkanesulfonate monooxygenase SsuD/methylene tetrahydromethanopterin reductase-like flavin-dependent oxidoreductase (luciferase family)
VPAELIDTITLVGPRERIRDRLAVYRDAGVGTLIVVPVGHEPAERRRMVREIAELL